MRLLIGLDRRDGGRDALELARVLGSRQPTEALIVTVLPYEPLAVAYEELSSQAAAEAAEPGFEEARELLEGLEVKTRAFGGGSAAGILTDLAEREVFDAIAIGCSHRGAVGRALLGSAGRGLLHGAPCPVAVAPRGYARDGHGPFGLVALAYDGSPEAKLALGRARELAESHGAAVRVLTVVAPTTLPGPIGYAPVVPPRPEEVLEEGMAALGPRLEVSGDLLSGPPAETLAGACEGDVDLLVVGSRRYGPVARVLLGSTTASLITMSPCPVMVVPRA